MADTAPADQAPAQAPAQGERREGGGRGRGFGGRGGRGGRGGPGGRGGQKEEWIPKTKLGRLVKGQFIKSLEEIYTFSIPIKEAQIVERLIEQSEKKVTLSDDVMKIISVQKQTKAGQRTRFKAIVAIGDQDGHIGLGVKVAKEVQIAIKGAIIAAKL